MVTGANLSSTSDKLEQLGHILELGRKLKDITRTRSDESERHERRMQMLAVHEQEARAELESAIGAAGLTRSVVGL